MFRVAATTLEAAVHDVPAVSPLSPRSRFSTGDEVRRAMPTKLPFEDRFGGGSLSLPRVLKTCLVAAHLKLAEAPPPVELFHSRRGLGAAAAAL